MVRQPPPPPLTARNPEGCIYLGSFSQSAGTGPAPGLPHAPKAVFPKLLQAKRAADLHTPGFNQRMVSEVMKAASSTAMCRPSVRCTSTSATPCSKRSSARWRPGYAMEHPQAACSCGCACRRHARHRTAAPGRGAQRGLRARRGVLCRQRRPAHAAPVVRDGQQRADQHRHWRAGGGHPGQRIPADGSARDLEAPSWASVCTNRSTSSATAR